MPAIQAEELELYACFVKELQWHHFELAKSSRDIHITETSKICLWVIHLKDMVIPLFMDDFGPDYTCCPVELRNAAKNLKQYFERLTTEVDYG